MSIYHTVYQTTNIVNNKIYVGVHSTSDPYDSYLGSGVAIKRAIEKYGKHNFTKEILAIYESSADAYQKEFEIVNSDFISRPDTYNQTIGGNGGWNHVHNEQTQMLARQNIRKFYNSKKGKSIIKALAKRNRGLPSPLKGTKNLISNETRQKLSIAKRDRVWINNGISQKTIHINENVPNGWSRGRLPSITQPKGKSYMIGNSLDGYITVCNLKQWCLDNHYTYRTVFGRIGKGIPNESYKFYTKNVTDIEFLSRNEIIRMELGVGFEPTNKFL